MLFENIKHPHGFFKCAHTIQKKYVSVCLTYLKAIEYTTSTLKGMGLSGIVETNIYLTSDY
jgi:hypothetical protein